MSIWNTLSAIDCKEHIETKGGFSYLSWSWAWAMVKENYPDATYRLLDDTVFSDGTMEVRVEVTIHERVSVTSGMGGVVFNSLSHTMWLPVLDFKNKAISKPNAFDINSARMRCLVKCLAMHGLGHYIYAGESAPQERQIEETKQMIQAGAELNKCLEIDDYPGAAQIYDEWSYEENSVICRSPSKGGQLTTANRAKLKETAFRLALNAVRGVEA